MKRISVRMLSVAALVSLLFGVGTTYYAARKVPETMRHLRQKMDALAELQALAELARDDDSAKAAFDRLPKTRPVPLGELIETSLPDARPQVRQRQKREITDGWFALQVEVVLNEVSLAKLAPFLHRAETQRPPWRLEACSIVASKSGAGTGRVTLLMEALSKTEAQVAAAGPSPP